MVLVVRCRDSRTSGMCGRYTSSIVEGRLYSIVYRTLEIFLPVGIRSSVEGDDPGERSSWGILCCEV